MTNLCYLNKKNPILSISLLTSNRKDSIRKCLDSVTALRKAVSSELVIVDTGCDAEMRSIIEEYTDKIVKFTWIQDFAAARNAGLKACSGKWFMYLDDDEWFEDTEDIEDFFTSGKYKLVQGCWYIQRNYIDMEGHRYTDDTVSRMMEIVPGLHFKGCIHEYLDPFDGQYTTVKSYVHHYGYIFKDEADKYKHLKRNLPLLFKMIDEEPDEMRWWLQIVQEYVSIKEYGKAIEFCEQGLTHFKATNDVYSNRQLGSFYISIIDAYYFTYDFESALSYVQKGLHDHRLSPLTMAALHESACRCYARLDNYPAAKEEALQYFELYEQLKDDEIALTEQSYYKTEETFAPRHMSAVYWIMIKEGILRKDTPQICEYFDKLDFSGPGLLLFDEYTLFDLIDYIATEPFDLWYSKIFTYLMIRPDLQPRIIAQLKNYEGIAPDSEYSDFIKKLIERYKFNDKKAFENIVRISSFNKIDNYYVDYLKVLSIDIEDSMPLSQEELTSCACRGIARDDEFLLYSTEYMKKVKHLGLTVWDMAQGLNYEYWTTCVDNMCLKSDDDRLEKIMNSTVLPRNASDNEFDFYSLPLSEDFKNGIRYQYFIMRTTEEVFRRSGKCSEYGDVRELLCNFIDSQINFYSSFYKEEVLADCTEILPKSCRVALVLNEALALEEDGNYREALAKYKEAIGIHPPVNDALQNYAHLYAENIKNAAPETELDILSRQIKNNAKAMIESGSYKQAQDILNQLKSMQPQDKEIDELLEQIYIKLNE